MALLRIVSVNDVYLLDNLPRLASLIAAARVGAERLLVVMAGDFVAPSILSSLDAGAGMVDCMNHVGFTHVVFGNHEDDIDPAQLAERVRELTAVCLGTNLPDYEPRLAPHDLLEIGGVRVGLCGVVMDDRTVYNRAPFGGTRLLPANAAAAAKIRELREIHRCDAVIALTHQPIPLDRALAAEAHPEVILGGHEHQVFVEHIGRTWLVKAGADAYRAAVIDLDHRDAGIVAREVKIEEVTRYDDDPALRAIVRAHLEKVRALESATLLRLPPGAELSSVGTREHETSLARLLATRVRDCLDAQIGILNGGAVRGDSVYHGRFSYGDLQREVPFANEVVVVPLPGATLQEALRASRAQLPSGGFLHTCDALETAPDGTIRAFRDGDFDAFCTYHVALVRNFFSGMDDIQPLVRFAHEHAEAIPPTGSGRDIKLVLLESFAAGLWDAVGPLARVDLDHDGNVSADELARSIATYTGDADPSVATGIVTRVLDRDGDGVLRPDELVTPPKTRT